MVVKFVKVFKKEGFTLNSEIDGSKHIGVFGSANHVPSCQGVAFVALVCFLRPKTFP